MAESLSPAHAFDTLQPGDALLPLVCPPLTRTTLALFAGASNDHNPIHIDIDFAKLAGLRDVIGHGMLAMAYLARVLTRDADPRRLRSFSVRFSGVVRIGDQITCTGKVVERVFESGEMRLRLSLAANDQQGDAKVVGEAVLAI